MSGEQDLDRSEEATPHKREEARKRGQTARSTDAASLTALSVAMAGCYALLEPATRDLARMLVHGLGAVRAVQHDPSGSLQLIWHGVQQAAVVLAPLLMAVVVGAVLVSLLLSGGLVISGHPLKPDFNRLNPAQGFKKFFSVRLLYEALKNSLKLLALIGVAMLAISGLMPQALQLLSLPEKALLLRWMESSGGLMAKLCGVLLLFMLVDLVFTRWDFMRGLRMSKREIEDEHKNREGDPRIKRRQRELRLQFLRASQAVLNVPQAQVVITNPTHLAVALRYEHGVTPAPLVVAKGRGVLALQIRREASRAAVPIVHSPRLARALYKEVALDGYVPEAWYPPVARILIWLRSLQEARTERGIA
jgi:flagellar biosynthetic protein FlhB